MSTETVVVPIVPAIEPFAAPTAAAAAEPFGQPTYIAAAPVPYSVVPSTVPSVAQFVLSSAEPFIGSTAPAVPCAPAADLAAPPVTPSVPEVHVVAEPVQPEPPVVEEKKGPLDRLRDVLAEIGDVAEVRDQLRSLSFRLTEIENADRVNILGRTALWLPLATPDGGAKFLSSASFLPESDFLVVAHDRGIDVLQFTPDRIVPTPIYTVEVPPENTVVAVALIPCTDLFAYAKLGVNGVTIFDIVEKKELRLLPTDSQVVRLEAAGKRIVAHHEGATDAMTVFDSYEDEAPKATRKTTGILSSTGKYLAEYNANTVKVFEKATEEGAITIDTGVKVTGVAFDSTENIIAVTHDNGIKVFHVVSKKMLASCESGHPIIHPKFSPAGGFVAAADPGYQNIFFFIVDFPPFPIVSPFISIPFPMNSYVARGQLPKNIVAIEYRKFNNRPHMQVITMEPCFFSYDILGDA